MGRNEVWLRQIASRAQRLSDRSGANKIDSLAVCRQSGEVIRGRAEQMVEHFGKYCSLVFFILLHPNRMSSRPNNHAAKRLSDFDTISMIMYIKQIQTSSGSV